MRSSLAQHLGMPPAMTAIRELVRRPAPFLFYALDRLHDGVLLPMWSWIWRLEGTLRGATIGRGSFLGRPMLKLHPLSRVVLASGFTLVSDQRRSTSGNVYAPCRIHTHSRSSSIYIGERVGMTGTSIVARSRSIHIGDGTMIAPNCVIMDSPYHTLWPPEDRGAYSGSDADADVFIAANCWIGAGCMILAGSRIGENSVVGARSVVGGEIPANSLAVGSPAKVVRKLDE